MKINPMQRTALQTPCKLSDIPIGGTFILLYDRSSLYISLGICVSTKLIRSMDLADGETALDEADQPVLSVACEVSFLNDKP